MTGPRFFDAGVGLALGALALAACSAGPALRVRAFFEPVGKLGTSTSRERAVASAEDVGIYLRSAPPGFSRSGTEVTVQQGYRHQILGFIRVGYGGGWCSSGPVGRTELLAVMKTRAFSEGGNAVVYAETTWTAATTGSARCSEDADPTYASGWVVRERSQEIHREPPEQHHPRRRHHHRRRR